MGGTIEPPSLSTLLSLAIIIQKATIAVFALNSKKLKIFFLNEFVS